MRAALAALLLAAPAAAADPVQPGLGALIDGVLAAPADPAAWARLREAATEAAARQKAAAALEKKALLAGAERDRKMLLELRALKAGRTLAWERELSAVCALAGSADTAGEAVAAYERLLNETPVYSDNREQVKAAGLKIKGIFYDTIKREFPYLVQGRTQTNERDIAALMFTRASVSDDNVRYLDTSTTQKVLDIAARLRRVEAELGVQHANLAGGLELYAKKRYAGALELLAKVLSFDSANEEALFYRARAEEESGAAGLNEQTR